MNDDTMLRSTWTGRPDRDYVPPGGMRPDSGDDEEAPSGPKIGDVVVVVVAVEASAEPKTATTPGQANQTGKGLRLNPLPKHPPGRAEVAPPPPSKALSGAADGRMRCECGGDLKCYDSRPRDGFRWRRYKCQACGDRTSTAEVPIPGGFNDKASADHAVSRVKLHFVREAETMVLLNELNRRAGGSGWQDTEKKAEKVR